MTASPMNPLAGASGPGKFSERTDMLTMPSSSYGEGVDTAAIKAGAPEARTRGIADNVGGRPAQPMKNIAAAQPVGFTEPSQRPNEPITTGIDMGPGAGSDALMINQTPDSTNFRANMAQYIPVLSYVSGLPNTSPETRKAIRQIMDQL